MFKIDKATAATVMPTPDAPGPNVDGFFQKGTDITADWLNAVQEEICYVITQSGGVLDKTDRTQLYQAIHDIMIAFGGLTAIVEDLSPELGGDLEVNGNKIFSASGDITIEALSGLIDLNAAIVLIGGEIQHLGDTNNKIVFGTDTQDFQVNGSSAFDISASGLRVGGANARITTIDNDTAMAADSATRLATQHAIKNYADNVSANVSVNANLFIVTWTQSSLAAGQTKYFAQGNATSTLPTATTNTVYEQYMPYAGVTGSGVYVAVDVAPGSGQSFVFTLMVNGVASALTMTISGTNTSFSGSITGGTLNINAGDFICWRVVASAGAATINKITSYLQFT